MKKKSIAALILSACVGLTAFASTGCGPSAGGEDAGNRLELRVYNYNGGVGSTWIDAAKTRFMEINKDRKFESGKEGVFLRITNDENISLENLKSRAQSVFFLEGVNFNNYVDDFVEITDIVTGENKYESGKKIVDKLSEDTQKALTGKKGGYYVLPHYQAYDGVMYNKTVFDENDLYFAKEEKDYKSKKTSDVEYGFIKNASCTKSVGPDGKPETDDDGLPSSVDEFIRLCEYMKEQGITPFAYFSNSNSAHTYQLKLVNALWANIEGYDGAMAQYRFNSNEKLSRIVTGFDGNGEPIVDEKVITEDNAYEVYQQESRYHALRFANYVFTDAKNYIKRSTESTDNYEIQRRFLQGEAAMMLEGTYWRNEARDHGTFNRYEELKSVETRYMPLPVLGTGTVTEENGLGKESTVIDTLGSYAFINANTESKYGKETLQIAKEFLQFCCTDESLAEFTVKSSVTKDFKYTISEEDYKALNTDGDGFAQSVWNVKGNDADKQHVVNPISGSPVYYNNVAEFTMYNTKLWSSKGYNYPTQAFKPGSDVTVKDYFEGMKKDQAWWNKLQPSEV